MAEKPICFVFGAGAPPVCPPDIAAQDMVIAADGGYTYTQRAGIRTDVLIGDFDSLPTIPDSKNGNPLIKRLPKEKDQTDLLAALQYGLEHGFERFHIYGGTGGRLDHTLANIQCLAYLVNQGARGYLHGNNFTATAFRGEIWLAARQSGVVSVFALGEPAHGVFLRGLKYELENATLLTDFPLGVSNEFTGQTVQIKAEQGLLAVIYPAGTQEIERPSGL